MLLRFKIWLKRRQASKLSMYSRGAVIAEVYGVQVGRFLNGKDVR